MRASALNRARREGWAACFANMGELPANPYTSRILWWTWRRAFDAAFGSQPLKRWADAAADRARVSAGLPPAQRARKPPRRRQRSAHP